MKKLLILFLTLFIGRLYAQTFQSLVGNSGDNRFDKTVPVGADYFVIGKNGAKATVTKLDANGNHVWSNQVNEDGTWSDIIVNQDGDIMVVGNFGPVNLTTNNQCLAGRVNPSTGAFIVLKSFNIGFQENFSRIYENPTPGNTTFPYYVIGAKNTTSGSGDDDLALLTFDKDFNFGSGRIYSNQGVDEEMFRDAFLGGVNGALMSIGNRYPTSLTGGAPTLVGSTILFDKNLGVIQGRDFSKPMYFLTGLSNSNPIAGFYQVLGGASTETGSFTAVIVRVNGNTMTYNYTIPSLKAITRIAFGDSGSIYALGVGMFGGIDKNVLLNLQDSGTGLTLNWAKMLDQSETAFANGYVNFDFANNHIIYTDSRKGNTNGNGDFDGLICVENSAFDNCMDISTQVALVNYPMTVSNYDISSTAIQVTPSNLTASVLQYTAKKPCSQPCNIQLAIKKDPKNNCGSYTFSGSATGGTAPYNYQWDLGCNGTIDGTTSPFTTTLGPGTQPFCVTVTDASGCSAVLNNQTVVVINDKVPPVIVCPPNITINCDQSINSLALTGNATATDVIDPSPVVAVLSTTQTSNGDLCKKTFERVFIATDACGNTSTCIQTIVQTDKTPPTISGCGRKKIVSSAFDAQGNCVGVAVFTPIVVSDNCDMSVSVTSSYSSTTFVVGQTIITYTAVDDCENKSTCMDTVIVLPCGQSKRPCGEAVVTCFPGFNSNTPSAGIDASEAVIAIINTKNHATAPLGSNWATTMHKPSTWTSANLGLVFGLAIDNVSNIYTSSSTVYGCQSSAFNQVGPGGFGAIYKIDPSDVITTFIGTGSFSPGTNKIPNNGSGLGNICYDKVHNQMFATNFQDGMIYRISLATGNVIDRFDPFSSTNAPSSDDPNFVTLGERTWGIAYNALDNKIYFSRWYEDRGRRNATEANEIWSIALTAAGAFNAISCSAGTCIDGENLELKMPYHIDTNDLTSGTFPTIPSYTLYSNPVSDIAFSNAGFMLLAERSMFRDCGDATDLFTSGFEIRKVSHNSRVLEFSKSGSAWNLSTGHSVTLPFKQISNGGPFAAQANYLNELKFVVGSNTAANTPAGANSSGGIDYGYDSFVDGTLPRICDAMVWMSGDFMQCSASNRIYGIQGNQATGGHGCNGVLIDFDGVVAASSSTPKAKVFQGDVELFRCLTCPKDTTNCKNVFASLTSIPSTKDSACCYAVNLTNNESSSITGFCLDLVASPNWIVNIGTINKPGYSWGIATGAGLCVKNPAGISSGTTSNVFSFCLTELLATAPTTQCLKTSWFKGDIKLECTDTLKTKCSPPTSKDTCFKITNIKVKCLEGKDNEYCVSFDVTNLSSFAATQFTLAPLPPGFMYGDCGCGGFPYGIGSTSWAFDWFTPSLGPGLTRSVCVKIKASSPVTSPTNVCVFAAIEGLQNCCHSPKKICFDLLPCCNPCEEVHVAFTPIENQDSCCYNVNVNYNCSAAYFDKIAFNILNGDVFYGSYSLTNPAWTLGATSGTQTICLLPNSGALSSINDGPLMRFCLTDIDDASEVPQFIKIDYYGPNGINEDTIKCDTIVKLTCQNKSHPCTFITNEKVECDKENMKYIITVDVQNISSPSFAADQLIIMPAPSISPNPIPLSPPLANDGSHRTVTFCYTPPTGGFPDADGKLVLVYKLRNIDGTCCNGNEFIYDTLMLPPCDSLCGYVCNGNKYEFTNDGRPLGLLSASVPSGYYPEYGSPTVVPGGCNGSNRSVQLNGINKGYAGDALGVRINGVVGPDTIFKKGKTYCIKFCAKYTKGLASSTAQIKVYSKIFGSEAIATYTLTTPNIWQEVELFYTPTADYRNLVIANVSVDPLDGPSTVFIDDIRIGFASPVYNDVTPPTITCPGDITLSTTAVPCAIKYTMPSISATDDNAVVSLSCTLDGSPISSGSIVSLGDGVHQVVCIATDICGNRDTCKYSVTVKCEQSSQCTCPNSNNVKFNLASGTNNYLLSCNSPTVPFLPCPVNNIIISGSFGCQGDTSKCKNVVQFRLDRPGSLPPIVGSSTISPAVLLSFLAADVTTPGLYTLTISTVCPGSIDTCVCVLRWKQKECPQDPMCKCGGFSNTKFCLLSTGTAVITECNLQNKIYNLPCPGTSLVNYCGTFKCNPDSCSPPAVNFALINTNTGATIHTTSLILNPMRKFTINLLPSWCNDPSVIYEIKVSGVCGNDTCVCITKFRVDCPQENKCKCDQKFIADVAQGFLQSSVAGNCVRKFEPRSLCPNDKVEWYRNGSLVSMTTGLASATFSINSGYGTVCMIVTRTESPNVICKEKFCLKTYCVPEGIVKCDGIENSGFANTIDGYLDDDGTMINWTKGEGWPYAFGAEGISDGNIMLIASKDMPSSIVCRNGAPPKQGFRSISLDAESYISAPIPLGSTLELEGIKVNGQRVLLSSIDVAGIRKGWDGTIKGNINIVKDDYTDFVLRLKTSSTDPVLLRLDNFCFELLDETVEEENKITFNIYPNPSTSVFNIDIKSSHSGNLKLEVYDMLGRFILRDKIATYQNHQLNLLDHASGMYIVKFTDDYNNVYEKKIVKIE